MKNFYVLVEVEGVRYMTSVHAPAIGDAFTEAEKKARATAPAGYCVQAIAAQDATGFWKAD